MAFGDKVKDEYFVLLYGDGSTVRDTVYNSRHAANIAKTHWKADRVAKVQLIEIEDPDYNGIEK